MISSEDRKRIVSLRQEGFTFTVIAREIKASEDHVARIYRRYVKEGDAGLNTKPRPGRPHKLKLDQYVQLKKWLSANDNVSQRQIKKYILETMGVNYSYPSIPRIIERVREAA